MTMAFCNSCGKEIHEDDVFCSHCGTRQGTTISLEKPVPPSPIKEGFQRDLKEFQQQLEQGETKFNSASLKNKIIGGYIVIGIMYALYGWQFGAYRYKGFMYNLGRGLVWPASVFPELGKFIGGVIWLIVIVAILLFVKEKRDR